MAYEDHLTEMPIFEIGKELQELWTIDSRIDKLKETSPESEEIGELFKQKNSLKITSILYADHARECFKKAGHRKILSAVAAVIPIIAIPLYKRLVLGEQLDFSDVESAIESLYNTGNVYSNAFAVGIPIAGAISVGISKYLENLNKGNFERLTGLRADDAYATLAIEKRANYILQKLGKRD